MTIQIADVARDENLEGYLIGSPVSIIREYAAAAGSGPRLHRHPYAETFIIHHGSALFTVGEERLVAVGVVPVAAFGGLALGHGSSAVRDQGKDGVKSTRARR